MSKVRMAAVLALALGATACTTKENTNTTTTPTPSNDFTKSYTLQGFVADATTGARVGGGDLQLFLIQGADVRTPTRLNSGASDPLLGEFAFAGIPADYNAGNKRYKVVAVKPGYQRFESEVVFTAFKSTVLDSVYNVIGNIYMFPIGATAPSLRYTVTYNGKPVPNATVILDPAPASSDPLYNTGSALASATGYLASLIATTDASGVATFGGANLALGGAYSVQVLPVAFTDTAGTTVQLARYDSATNVVVGLADADRWIALSDLTYANVYVVSASNQPVGQVNASGALAITFSAPVALRNPTGFTATLTGGTGVLGAPPVTATLSADNRTLTLAPNLSTPLGAADVGVTITYGNGTAFVEPLDYPAASGPVFGGTGPTLPNGLAVNPAVVMRAP
jgi:hypothetical protein